MFPKLAPYYKAVVTVVNALIVLAGTILTMNDVLPANVLGIVATVSSLLNVAAVYLVKNQPLIVGEADAGEHSVEAILARVGDETKGTRVGSEEN